MIDDAVYEVEVDQSAGDYSAASMRTNVRTTIQSCIVRTTPRPVSSKPENGVDESKVCRSPVAGIVIRVHARPGEELQRNDLIVVLEAMKMETRISAPQAGKIKSLKVAPGDAVRLNQILADFE